MVNTAFKTFLERHGRASLFIVL